MNNAAKYVVVGFILGASILAAAFSNVFWFYIFLAAALSLQLVNSIPQRQK